MVRITDVDTGEHHKRLSALLAEQRAICDELTATSEHLRGTVERIIAVLREHGWYAEYAGPVPIAAALLATGTASEPN
jgi:hypothetical protein